MTYHNRTLTLSIECEYTVDPGYRATRVDPAEPPSVQDLTVTIYLDGDPVELPDDLMERLTPDEDTLIAHANGRLQAMREDQAEYRMERVG